MGKAVIRDHEGDGLYTIEYVPDLSRALKLLSDIDRDTSQREAETKALSSRESQARENLAVASASWLSDPDNDEKKAVCLAAKSALSGIQAALRAARSSLVGLSSKREFIEQNLPSLPIIFSAWCADYSTEIPAGTVVGTCEPRGEYRFKVPPVIFPAWDNSGDYQAGAAVWDLARDGKTIPPVSLGTIQNFFFNAIMPWWMIHHAPFRLGTVTAIDYDADTMTVRIDDSLREGYYEYFRTPQAVDSDCIPIRKLHAGGETTPQGVEQVGGVYPSLEGTFTALQPTASSPVFELVPVQYMDCNASAFLVGDRVLVRYRGGGKIKQPTVIGFESNPRACLRGGFISKPYDAGIGQDRDVFYLPPWEKEDTTISDYGTTDWSDGRNILTWGNKHVFGRYFWAWGGTFPSAPTVHLNQSIYRRDDTYSAGYYVLGACVVSSGGEQWIIAACCAQIDVRLVNLYTENPIQILFRKLRLSDVGAGWTDIGTVDGHSRTYTTAIDSDFQTQWYYQGVYFSANGSKATTIIACRLNYATATPRGVYSIDFDVSLSGVSGVLSDPLKTETGANHVTKYIKPQVFELPYSDYAEQEIHVTSNESAVDYRVNNRVNCYGEQTYSRQAQDYQWPIYVDLSTLYPGLGGLLTSLYFSRDIYDYPVDATDSKKLVTDFMELEYYKRTAHLERYWTIIEWIYDPACIGVGYSAYPSTNEIGTFTMHYELCEILRIDLRAKTIFYKKTVTDYQSDMYAQNILETSGCSINQSQINNYSYTYSEQTETSVLLNNTVLRTTNAASSGSYSYPAELYITEVPKIPAYQINYPGEPPLVPGVVVKFDLDFDLIRLSFQYAINGGFAAMYTNSTNYVFFSDSVSPFSGYINYLTGGDPLALADVSDTPATRFEEVSVVEDV